MKNILKRVIVGIIIGLVLMFARKYLFISVNAATRVSPTMDVYRFTYNDGNFKQVGFNGQNADLTESTLGATNSGSLQYYFHTSSDIDIHKGDILYFSIGTSAMNSSSTFTNSTFSFGTNGYLTTGLDSNYFTCEVSSIIVENDTLQEFFNRAAYVNSSSNTAGLLFQTANHQIDLRFVSTYKCTFDQDTKLLASPNNNVKISSPNMSYSYGTWSFYSRGISFILITNNIESMILDSQNASTQAINETNDTLNDDSIGTQTDDDISNLQNTDISSTEDAGIQDLITLPIELFNGILSALNGSCSPYRIGSLLGEDVILPCFNLGGVLGSVWNIIDIVISSCIFFKFATKLKEIFINLTSLNENKGDLIE